MLFYFYYLLLGKKKCDVGHSSFTTELEELEMFQSKPEVVILKIQPKLIIRDLRSFFIDTWVYQK